MNDPQKNPFSLVTMIQILYIFGTLQLAFHHDQETVVFPGPKPMTEVGSAEDSG